MERSKMMFKTEMGWTRSRNPVVNYENFAIDKKLMHILKNLKINKS